MAAFRRRPITIGNARPTGLAGIILDEYRANDIPLEKEMGAERSRETARISRRKKFRQGLQFGYSSLRIRFVVASSRANKATGDEFFK